MKTEDIQKFLASDPEVQRIVCGRVGLADDGTWDEGAAPADETALWPKWGKNPKKWVREWKVSYGSKAWIDKKGQLLDTSFFKKHYGFDPTGAIIRRFWLRDTDHVSIEVWEKDGKIVLADDVSD